MRGNCTPEQQASCPLLVHFTDTHHKYHPARNYRDGLGKTFRELPENKEQPCRYEHNEKHATEPIPERPSREYMLGRIAMYVEQLGRAA